MDVNESVRCDKVQVNIETLNVEAKEARGVMSTLHQLPEVNAPLG